MNSLKDFLNEEMNKYFLLLNLRRYPILPYVFLFLFALIGFALKFWQDNNIYFYSGLIVGLLMMFFLQNVIKSIKMDKRLENGDIVLLNKLYNHLYHQKDPYLMFLENVEFNGVKEKLLNNFALLQDKYVKGLDRNLDYQRFANKKYDLESSFRFRNQFKEVEKTASLYQDWVESHESQLRQMGYEKHILLHFLNNNDYQMTKRIVNHDLPLLLYFTFTPNLKNKIEQFNQDLNQFFQALQNDLEKMGLD